MELTTSAEVNSSFGSRAAYTSVTMASSASLKAWASSRRELWYREYVCGCQTAQILSSGCVPRTFERCLDLSWMVGIIHRNADAVRLAAQLEAPPGACKTFTQGACAAIVRSHPSASAIARTAGAHCKHYVCLRIWQRSLPPKSNPALPRLVEATKSNPARATLGYTSGPSPVGGC